MFIDLPAAINLSFFNLSHSQGIRPLSFSRHFQLCYDSRKQDDTSAVASLGMDSRGFTADILSLSTLQARSTAPTNFALVS